MQHTAISHTDTPPPDKTPQPPGADAPNSAKDRIIVLAMICTAVLAVVVFSRQPQTGRPNPPPPSPSNSIDTHSLPEPIPTPASTPEVTQPAWEYRTDEDEMGRGRVKTAMIATTDSEQYKARAHLILRLSPKYGLSAYVALSEGAFLCNAVTDCTVAVRFDDRKLRHYSATGAADYSGKAVFFNDAAGFIKQLKTSKIVKIEADMLWKAPQVLEFQAEGLVW